MNFRKRYFSLRSSAFIVPARYCVVNKKELIGTGFLSPRIVFLEKREAEYICGKNLLESKRYFRDN